MSIEQYILVVILVLWHTPPTYTNDNNNNNNNINNNNNNDLCDATPAEDVLLAAYHANYVGKPNVYVGSLVEGATDYKVLKVKQLSFGFKGTKGLYIREDRRSGFRVPQKWGTMIFLIQNGGQKGRRGQGKG